MAKKELFDHSLQQTALYFKALAHPARLAILHYLIETGSCMTGDITEELPLSRTTVGQHLLELKNCKLIQGTVEGSKVNYCINTENLAEIVAALRSMADKLENSTSITCC